LGGSRETKPHRAHNPVNEKEKCRKAESDPVGWRKLWGTACPISDDSAVHCIAEGWSSVRKSLPVWADTGNGRIQVKTNLGLANAITAGFRRVLRKDVKQIEARTHGSDNAIQVRPRSTVARHPSQITGLGSWHWHRHMAQRTHTSLRTIRRAIGPRPRVLKPNMGAAQKASRCTPIRRLGCVCGTPGCLKGTGSRQSRGGRDAAVCV
jgi:hypothetical protein